MKTKTLRANISFSTYARLFRDFVKPYFKGLGMGDLGDGGAWVQGTLLGGKFITES